MKLETAGSRDFPEVDEQQLRQAFDDDDSRGDFVILSQAREVYLQAAGEGDGPYCLEYRDGHRHHHFSAVGELRKSDVLRAFLWYLAGDPRWRSEFRWEKMIL